jgi:hypothetical protein
MSLNPVAVDRRENLKVYIGRDVFLYSEKEPYTQSGQSAHGVLVLNPEEDQVQCHECGEWFTSLPEHIWRQHRMKIRAYKIKHGLPIKAALCNERIRQRLISAGKTEFAKRGSAMAEALLAARSGVSPGAIKGRPYYACRNRRGRCKEQILRDLRLLGERLGRYPSSAELASARIDPQSVEFLFGLSFREVVRLAGLVPPEPKPHYTRVMLTEMLRDFYVKNHRLPSASDRKRGLIPGVSHYVKVFGSLSNAYYAAGLEEVAKVAKASQGFQVIHSAKSLEKQLRDYVATHGRLPRYKEWENGIGIPTSKTFRRYFPDFPALREQISREVLNQQG